MATDQVYTDWLARFNFFLYYANRARLAALAATNDATRRQLHREADRHIQAIVELKP